MDCCFSRRALSLGSLTRTFFSGEQSFGTTAGAPLSTNSSNQLVSGVSNSEVSATTATTTTATADSVMATMTVTPVAGTYHVNFSSYCSHSTSGATITISLYFNGAQKTDSVRIIIPFPGGLGAATLDVPVAINAIVAANGTNPVAIEWHTNAGTATCTQRTLDLVRLN